MIVVSLVVCAAQTPADKPPEPESIGSFYYFDASAKALKPLPKEEYRRHTGGGRHPVATIIVEGAASSFHVAQSDQKTFVFKVFKDEDAGRAKIYQFTANGSGREYALGSWKGRDYVPNTGLQVNVGKFGDSTYKVTPEAPLAPGEYALTLGSTLFTFGVH